MSVRKTGMVVQFIGKCHWKDYTPTLRPRLHLWQDLQRLGNSRTTILYNQAIVLASLNEVPLNDGSHALGCMFGQSLSGIAVRATRLVHRGQRDMYR